MVRRIFISSFIMLPTFCIACVSISPPPLIFPSIYGCCGSLLCPPFPYLSVGVSTALSGVAPVPVSVDALSPPHLSRFPASLMLHLLPHFADLYPPLFRLIVVLLLFFLKLFPPFHFNYPIFLIYASVSAFIISLSPRRCPSRSTCTHSWVPWSST